MPYSHPKRISMAISNMAPNVVTEKSLPLPRSNVLEVCVLVAIEVDAVCVGAGVVVVVDDLAVVVVALVVVDKLLLPELCKWSNQD